MAQQSLEQMQEAIQKVITDDPTLRDASKISVEMLQRGPFWKRQAVVRVTGKVVDDRESEKVVEHVHNHAPEARIENLLHAAERPEVGV